MTLSSEQGPSADEWSQRLEAVHFHNEPALYVTPAEYRQLRQTIDRIAYERSLTDLQAFAWRPTNSAEPIVSMTGFPVVVDTVEAARQAALVGSTPKVEQPRAATVDVDPQDAAASLGELSHPAKDGAGLPVSTAHVGRNEAQDGT